MNELISLNQSTINGELQQTVNARELHAFLQSKQEFANWIKNRIEQYGFVENQDFLTILSKSTGGRPSSTILWKIKTLFLLPKILKQVCMADIIAWTIFCH